jgi:hypothetical protein
MKKRRILYSAVIVLVMILLGAVIYINSVMPIITGYAAKNLCSDVFVSGRKAKDVEAVDLNFSFIRFTKNRVDYEEKSVTSRFLWGRSKAIYRDGFGGTLLRDVSENELRQKTYPVIADPEYLADTTLWPLGNILPDPDTVGINMSKIKEITRQLITENAYNGYAFAFMVLHNGIPLTEAYKPGFNMNTRLLSWSVAKSFMNGIAGTLVKEGRLDLTKPAEVEEWKNDNRKYITLGNLLQMQSGLKWNEDYGSRSDVNLMLFNEGDMGRYAIERPLENQPGSKWHYSSGSPNIVSLIIRDQFRNDSLYYTFVQDKFFHRIGITDAVLEVDPSGTYIGSSFLYATARDYARFGF